MIDDPLKEFYIGRQDFAVANAQDTVKLLKLSGDRVSGSIPTFITSLNSSLQSKDSKTRNNVILLITAALEEFGCQLSENFMYFGKTALNCLQKGLNETEQVNQLELLKVMFTCCKQKADLTRDIVGDMLPTCINLLLKKGYFENDRFRSIVLDFCSLMFFYFPSIMKSFHEKMNNVCHGLLFKTEGLDFDACLRCLNSTSNAGGKLGCKNFALTIYQLLLGSSDKLLELLLVDFEEPECRSMGLPSYLVPEDPFPSDYFKSVPIIADYIVKSFDAISNMTAYNYVGAILVPLRELISIVERVSYLNSQLNLKPNANKERAVLVQIYFDKIQASALKVLNSLYRAFESKLYRFRTCLSDILCRFIQVSNKKTGLGKIMVDSIWCMYHYKAFCPTKICESEIINLVKSCMTPKRTIKVENDCQTTKNTSKKRVLFETKAVALSTISDQESFLKSCLISRTLLMNRSTVGLQLEQILISHLLLLKANSKSYYHSKIQNFYPEEVRVVLYQCLIYLSFYDVRKDQSSILSLAVGLFKFGLKDTPDVVQVCEHGLSCIEKICHPWHVSGGGKTETPSIEREDWNETVLQGQVEIKHEDDIEGDHESKRIKTEIEIKSSNLTEMSSTDIEQEKTITSEQNLVNNEVIELGHEDEFMLDDASPDEDEI